ncbi:hypothetical protein QQ054_22085 [Oscillatoria amoena NRMC-F 0135]|nr:hypothetical protein [Oscillatoria amoena NRMC-F 0135]
MPLYRPTRTLRVAAPFVLISIAFGCGKKEAIVLPPIQVNVVKAIQNDVPLYEDFVAQVYGQADVDIRARV